MRGKKLLLFPVFLWSLFVFNGSSQELTSFVGVGDMMFGTDFPSPNYLPAHDNPSLLIHDVVPVFKESDVVFGNLEGCFLDVGPVVKRCKDTTKCYAFKSPERYVSVLSHAGFSVVNLANNHIRDFGVPGLTTTKNLLESNGIPYAGLIDKPCDTLWVNGKKIGVCGFSPNTGTARINDIAGAKAIVADLKSKCDFVLVSFHGGAEGAKHQNVNRETEMFYGENRGNVYHFAHEMIDSGADVIFGHGPHVPRAVEVYKNRFIAYSLGNFCTYSRFNLTGANALTPVVKVWVNDEGEFQKGKIFAFKQVKGVGVVKDPHKAVVRKIKDLTTMDFPELRHRLAIDESGDLFMVLEKPLISKGLPVPPQLSVGGVKL